MLNNYIRELKTRRDIIITMKGLAAFMRGLRIDRFEGDIFGWSDYAEVTLQLKTDVLSGIKLFREY